MATSKPIPSAHTTWTATEHNTILDAVAELQGIANGGLIPPVDPTLAPYNAVGDGVTDDSDALRTALATGRDVYLSRGKTFLISKPLQMTVAKQWLYGHGKLKRRNQWSTTLSVGITGGAGASFTVASATNIRAGQQVTIYDNASVYEYSVLNAPRTVVSVVGNVVTLDGTITNSFLVGATVYLAGFAIDCSAADVVIEGIEIDGNNSNWTFGRWQTSAEINASLGCDRLGIRDCFLHDGASEAILDCDSIDTRIERCRIYNFQGNGIHTGSETGTPGLGGGRIMYNHIENCNLNAALPHADGCVSLSSVVADILVHGNYMKAALCGVGSINSTDNSDVTITDNEIRNMTRAAIDGHNSSASAAARVVIQGNRIYSSAALNIWQGGSFSSTVFPTNYIISGNYLYQTPIALNCVVQAVVEGNIVDGGTDTTSTMVALTGLRDTVIRGNVVIGGSIGIAFSDLGVTSGATSTLIFSYGVKIDGNTCSGQALAGIQATGDNVPALHITDNTVEAKTTAAIGYIGILAPGLATVRGNQVFLSRAGTAGLKITGPLPVAKNNTVRAGLAATPSLAYPNAVLADSPSSYWRLGEATGTSALDKVGAITGTYTSVTLAQTGLVSDTDTATLFTAASSVLTVGNNYGFTGNVLFSAEFWFKPTSLPGSTARLVSKDSAGTGWEVSVSTAGQLQFQRYGTGQDNVFALTNVVGGSIYHVVATYDGTNMRLYVNGVLQGTTLSSRAVTSNAVNLTIGALPGGTSNITGVIDEVAIYSGTALSQARVSAHYNAGLPPSSIVVDSSAVNARVTDNEVDVAVVDNGTTSTLSANTTQAVWPNRVANPNFETNLTGWTASGIGALNAGATLTQDATQSWLGASSMKVVTTNASAAQGAYSVTTPATTFNGAAYTASMYIRGNAGGEILDILVGDTVNGYATVSSIVLTTAWKRFTVTQIAAAAGTAGVVVVRTHSAVVATFFVDAVQVTQTGFPVTYTDA